MHNAKKFSIRICLTFLSLMLELDIQVWGKQQRTQTGGGNEKRNCFTFYLVV